MCLIQSAYADDIKVIPIGKAVGIRLFTDGLLVVGTTDVNGKNAARDSGIKINDRIKEVNGKRAASSEELSEIVNVHPEGVTLGITRGNREIEVYAVPALAEDNVYRLGLWVRDSAAGIGTVTYYNPSTKNFAALGHSVNDVDTGNILSVRSGNILSCDILSVAKSKKGEPGEINGVFENDKIGSVYLNSEVGIFGKAESDEFSVLGGAVSVAPANEIKTGDAYILSDAFTVKPEKYSIRISKITDDADKELVIEITDSTLLEKSGGIVQGMSGSPIIQNGRLIGAVTHVLVNNPKRGYGTIAQSMIDAESHADI